MFACWSRGSRLKRWLVALGGAFTLVLLAAVVLLRGFLAVPTLPLPAGVAQRTERMELTGKAVKVDFYWPAAATNPLPLVVIAHGFSRNRRTMAGWGALLAREGFLVAVPDLPAWADHARNGRALAGLLADLQSGKFISQPKPAGRAALVGFSAGGFSSLLAAEGNTNVTCWVGLDPVGLGPASTRTAASLKLPAFVLRAEPAPWNANGNARLLYAALPGPAFSLVVKQASHVDAEYPTSRAAEWACGASAPARRELFGQYLAVCLRAGLLREETALRQLAAATNDAAVKEVEFRRREEFRKVP